MSMKRNVLKGAFTGVIFAFVAYFLASVNGFNESSFTLLLYLYVFLGVLASVELTDFETDLFDKIVIVAEEEELKMKKLFTGEEYRVKGTVEKV